MTSFKMPQGGKKTPFSGKAKKAQLMAKRDKKSRAEVNQSVVMKVPDDEEEDSTSKFTDVDLQVSNKGRNRYVLQFKPETKKEMAQNREKARQPLKMLTQDEIKISTEMFFNDDHDFPKRPPWQQGCTKKLLEMNEEKYFREYMVRFLDNPKMSYFELNLETWRQLWRVVEMSDVILFILDIRYAAAMFPPSLYHHIQQKDKKMVLVLNKVDLVSPELAAAWKSYFTQRFPELRVVFFTSFPAYNLTGATENKQGLKIRKGKGSMAMAKEGALGVWEVCQELVKDQVDLGSWKRLIGGDSDTESLTVENSDTREDFGNVSKSKYNDGILTIGTLGQPNVGKSSLINSLCGRKLVSVSKTPGHTKHFQTIFLTKSVKLCDCPGLVFPSEVPKPLQTLMGSFPIAQVREPYSIVNYLAERIDIPFMLNLQLPEETTFWSAFTVCEAWAIKRNYTTARTNRPDTARASNQILRYALDGRLCLALPPKGFISEEWEEHPDTVAVREVLGAALEQLEDIDEEDSESGEEEELVEMDNKFMLLAE